jgi:hypothetical protein
MDGLDSFRGILGAAAASLAFWTAIALMVFA